MGAQGTDAAGTLAWVKVATSDVASASAFYSGLFGWTAEEGAGGMGPFTLFRLGGRIVASGHALSAAEWRRPVPPHWDVQFGVESAARSVSRARELGAMVVWDALDVGELGRVGVLLDPTGAMLQVWEAKARPDLELRDAPGAVLWTELVTRDPQAAARFYRGLFGWGRTDMELGPDRTYTLFTHGPRRVAGAMAMPPEVPAAVPPHWLVYFEVVDCEAAVTRCEALGGRSVTAPMEAPGVGRFAVLADREGAPFAVMQRAAAR